MSNEGLGDVSEETDQYTLARVRFVAYQAHCEDIKRASLDKVAKASQALDDIQKACAVLGRVEHRLAEHARRVEENAGYGEWSDPVDAVYAAIRGLGARCCEVAPE